MSGNHNIAFNLVTVAFGYLSFAFIGSSINPFRSPHGRIRRLGWKLGREVGLGVMISGLLASLFIRYLQISLVSAATIFILIAMLLGLFSSWRYFRALATLVPRVAKYSRDTTVSDIGELPFQNNSKETIILSGANRSMARTSQPISRGGQTDIDILL